ncbi:hypothetical protein ACFVQ3_17620 [Oerskovia sp. NPDC057915]|uniref:hypothetical protein n=1 Tax=Oerskovia sp. NPDC057915 TaxID=3346280 RepID=UPI0036D8A2C5
MTDDVTVPRNRGDRGRRTRRVLGVAGALGALALAVALAVPALTDDLTSTGPAEPTPEAFAVPGAAPAGTLPGTASSPDAETPRETNGVQDCSEVTLTSGAGIRVSDGNGGTYLLGGFEGWWNNFPADADGNVLPVEEWPQEVLDHPVTAQVETRDGTVLETFDRRSCGSVPGYVPPPLDTLPADSIVVLDVETGEILTESALPAP